MKFKKSKTIISIALFFLVAGIVFSTGCLDVIGLGGEPSAQEIQEKAWEATADLDSYSILMKMGMTGKAESTEEGSMPMPAGQLGFSTDMELEGDVDNKNKKAHLTYTTTANLFGMQQTENGEIYAMGNTIYTKTDTPMPGSSSQWTKQTGNASSAWWDNLKVDDQALNILESASLEKTGEEKIGEDDCYVLFMEPDPEEAFDLLIPAAQSESITPSDKQEFVDAVEEFNITLWVRKDDFRIKKYSSIIKANPEEGNSMEMTIEISMELSNYNQEFDITLPEEAENAEEVSASVGSISPSY